MAGIGQRGLQETAAVDREEDRTIQATCF